MSTPALRAAQGFWVDSQLRGRPEVLQGIDWLQYEDWSLELLGSQRSGLLGELAPLPLLPADFNREERILVSARLRCLLTNQLSSMPTWTLQLDA